MSKEVEMWHFTGWHWKQHHGQKVNMTFKGLGNILTLLQDRTFSLTQIIHIVAASEVNFSTDFWFLQQEPNAVRSGNLFVYSAL